MTTGDKGKLFILFVPLFTLPKQQDCVLSVVKYLYSFFNQQWREKNLTNKDKISRYVLPGHQPHYKFGKVNVS